MPVQGGNVFREWRHELISFCGKNHILSRLREHISVHSDKPLFTAGDWTTSVHCKPMLFYNGGSFFLGGGTGSALLPFSTGITFATG